MCCPSESSVYADMDAAYEWYLKIEINRDSFLGTFVPFFTCLTNASHCSVTKNFGVPPSEILVFGRSIGSGPAVELGFRHPKEVAGMILESPFLSAYRVVSEDCATKCLCCCDVFKNIDKVAPLD